MGYLLELDWFLIDEFALKFSFAQTPLFALWLMTTGQWIHAPPHPTQIQTMSNATASLSNREEKQFSRHKLRTVCWLPPFLNFSLKVAVKSNNEKYETGQLLMRRMLRLFYQEERSVFQN